MIIVQVAPYIIPLPGSGGLERVVYNLTEALVAKGHEVYVYAMAGSRSSGIVIPYGHRWKDWDLVDFVLETMPDDFDILHDHTHDLIFGQKKLRVPVVSTFHTEWAMHIPASNPVFVSKTKLKQSPHRNHGYYVHNGIDLDQYEFSTDKRDYLLFLGRIDWEKGVPDAIRVAELTGQKLIIAGPIWDEELYDKIRPRIKRNPNIEYVGEVHGERKQDLLKHAKWVLFPTACEEQFGLVIVEAMACGTPVAAYRRGAIPEVLEGYPEFLCKTPEEMARIVTQEPAVSPAKLRRYVEDRYTKEKMAEGYLEIYKKVIRKGR
ncbi:glycosyltransferase family 4 protein [Paenibacillus thermotolerans]|uniref:glycosyltransferase family 4 protein n=1 Tax=Paenibacillus thermotolerans TaxID=3027807 RepID=UPI002367E5DC|nr:MULTISPECIES: glycosyltransferase family 4 protein [unclassified Paenibacillus]